MSLSNDPLLDIFMEQDRVFSSVLAWNSTSIYYVSDLIKELLRGYLRLKDRSGHIERANMYLRELERLHDKVFRNSLEPYDQLYFVNVTGDLPYQLEDMTDISSILDIADLCKGLTKNECMLKLKEDK